jgi:outer membrane protein assembly factor BamB
MRNRIWISRGSSPTHLTNSFFTLRVACLLAIAAGLWFSPGRAAASDWPQWRGPQRDGLSQEAGLLKEWPKDGPKLVWQVTDVDRGFSTPAVIGDRLYLLSNEGLDNEYVQARSASDGKRIWTAHLGKVGNPKQQPNYPAARSTPTLDGELLFALSSDGDLACLETATGKVRWQKSLRSDFGGKPGIWAYAESPLIDGDTLVCTPGGTNATLVALNKKTGDVLWKCPVPGGDEAAYSSAIIVDLNGLKQYVQFVQHGLVGVDAQTGKFLWRYDRTAHNSPAVIPTPVAADGSIYSAAAMAGGGLIKLQVNDHAVAVEPGYFTAKLPTAIGGVVKVGDNMYGTTSEALLCFDFASGTVKWKERAIGAASLCYADGALYLHGENGEVALVEAKPDAYELKGHFTPPDQPDRGQAKAWAYPVVANGRLYIRDLACLWCYDIKDSTANR